MIQNREALTQDKFDKGLVTNSDILSNKPNQTPNCMNIKWNADDSIEKRSGSTTMNTIKIGSGPIAGWTIDSGGTLSTSIQSYWKLDETSSTRFDSFGTNNLTDVNANVASLSGIRGLAASYTALATQSLVVFTNTSLEANSGNFSVSAWAYFNATGIYVLAGKRTTSIQEWQIFSSLSSGIYKIGCNISSDGTTTPGAAITANSFGAVNTGTWYNIIMWQSGGSHIGLSVNLSVNTATFVAGMKSTSAPLCIGNTSDGGTGADQFDGRIDEVGFWKKVLTAQERSDLYGGGSGNTYTGVGAAGFPWASFDFGASSIRWLTAAAGTGVYASSNLGVSFVSIATSRTQNYQFLNRSKNVMIATSDSYDVPLYWAGSVGTFASTLAPNSAPSVRYSINYQGFLILLNSSTRKRGFFYEDENTQLTSAWPNSFDLPSSADDEITCSFVLKRILYVSTRYKIFKVSFVGGNPDWSYVEVKNYGFVPRTVEICTLKGEEVAIGLDWSRHLRVFSGSEDLIVSDDIENNNVMCDFAMQKISLSGSGLVICNSEFDSQEQEYRLNVAIGNNSAQTTHAIVLNVRTLAFYPYSNQMYNTMVMAESDNRQFLMAFDRSGYCHMLNTGNLDSNTTPINDVYDSPFLYKGTPAQIEKTQFIDFFFSVSSSRVILKDRTQFSSVFEFKKQINLIESNSLNLIQESVDIPSTHNVYQYQLSSSSSTAEPWKLSRTDYYLKTLGIGRG